MEPLSVWPAWPIVLRFLATNFPTKITQILGGFSCFLKTSHFVETAATTLGVPLETFGLLFNPISGHRDRGSNPVIGKFYILSTVSKQCKKTKMKKKNGNGPFYKFYLQDNELDTRETKRRWTDIFWKRHCCWSQHCLEIASTQKLKFQNIFNYCCSWCFKLFWRNSGKSRFPPKLKQQE